MTAYEILKGYTESRRKISGMSTTVKNAETLDIYKTQRATCKG